MPHVFTDDAEPVRLIVAYGLLPPPRPSLPHILTLIRKGEITASRDGSFWMVPSISFFAEEVADCRERGLIVVSGRNGTTRSSFVPNGCVVMIVWCREHVEHAAGREKGLFDNGKAPQFTSTVRSYLAAGVLPSALPGYRNVWCAPAADIKAWLERDFGIYVR